MAIFHSYVKLPEGKIQISGWTINHQHRLSIIQSSPSSGGDSPSRPAQLSTWKMLPVTHCPSWKNTIYEWETTPKLFTWITVSSLSTWWFPTPWVAPENLYRSRSVDHHPICWKLQHTYHRNHQHQPTSLSTSRSSQNMFYESKNIDNFPHERLVL